MGQERHGPLGIPAINRRVPASALVWDNPLVFGQLAIAQKIIDGGGDDVLGLKDNHPSLYDKARALMLDVDLERRGLGKNHGEGSSRGTTARFDCCTQTDGDHGRIKTRSVLVCDHLQHLGGVAEGWAAPAAVITIHSRRECGDGKVSEQTRLYLSSSIKGLNASRRGELIRGHGSVENNPHWQQDVSLDEDQRRIRKGHRAENFLRLCRLSLNLLKRDKVKAGIKSKRLTAGWDHEHLLSLLQT